MMYTTSIGLLDQLREQAASQSWVRFVELYTPLLHYWASHLPGVQEADVNDLVQDVFLILLNKLPSFHYNPGQTFRGWLRTILLNHWRDRPRGREALRSAPEACLDHLASPDHAEEIVAAEYRQFLVGRALQLMQTDFEPTTWQACWQCVAMGRPASEVARDLGMSVAAVYIAKSRVLRQLRQELEGLLE
jgi:RNA polymerase sigma-70 factor, ECF subfamily